MDARDGVSSNGNGGGPTEDPVARLLLEQLQTRGATADPLMAALIESMVARRSAGTGAEATADYEAKLRRARRVIARLRDAVRGGDVMALYVAETFGACEVCWGLNAICPRCSGQGRPGFRRPNEEQLLGWVTPALTALGLRVVRTDDRQGNQAGEGGEAP